MGVNPCKTAGDGGPAFAANKMGQRLFVYC
jgi:hypothetical protein